MLLATVHEYAFGTKRAFQPQPRMSAFGGKADIRIQGRHVR